jgi:hypothetical protein
MDLARQHVDLSRRCCRELSAAGAAALATVAVILPAWGAEVLVEAETFDEYGGWILDSQFVDQMGSPYLLAHGLAVPVANARTKVHVPEAGQYRVWVRAKDWVPSHHPGRFHVSINGESLKVEFGANGKDWAWQDGGLVQLSPGAIPIELVDGIHQRASRHHQRARGVRRSTEEEEWPLKKLPLLCWVSCFSRCRYAAQEPNVIIVFTDDQGFVEALLRQDGVATMCFLHGAG